MFYGFCEYAKLYVRLFDHQVSHGYEVFFFDQRGSGRASLGKQGVTKVEWVMNHLDFFLEKNIAEMDPYESIILEHYSDRGVDLDNGIRRKTFGEISNVSTIGTLIQLVMLKYEADGTTTHEQTTSDLQCVSY